MYMMGVSIKYGYIYLQQMWFDDSNRREFIKISE